ncbi:MAG: hypothetical protein IPL28_23360 [Chloroflexi bacterium]|nr:hypothetical protein [Chloroflexota bacterium]
MQAIALTLSLATRRTQSISMFNWHGFLPERISSLGPTFVELQVVFDAEEIALTNELFEVWYDSRPPEDKQTKQIIPPSSYPEVTLRLEQGRITSPQGFAATLQFLGRYYVKQLLYIRPDLQEKFNLLGDIFWFDQHRNLGSVMMRDDWNGDGGGNRESWEMGCRTIARVFNWLVGASYNSGPARQRLY